MGVQKEAISERVRGCFQRFFSLLSKLKVYCTLPMLHCSSFIYGLLSAFFTANTTVFFGTIVIGS